MLDSESWIMRCLLSWHASPFWWSTSSSSFLRKGLHGGSSLRADMSENVFIWTSYPTDRLAVECWNGNSFPLELLLLRSYLFLRSLKAFWFLSLPPCTPPFPLFLSFPPPIFFCSTFTLSLFKIPHYHLLMKCLGLGFAISVFGRDTVS